MTDNQQPPLEFLRELLQYVRDEQDADALLLIQYDTKNVPKIYLFSDGQQEFQYTVKDVMDFYGASSFHWVDFMVQTINRKA